MRTQKTSYPLEWFCAKERLIFKCVSQLKTFPLEQSKREASLCSRALDAPAEPVPKLPSTAHKLSHLAAFSTSQQTTHPDADTQTTCARNAAQRGNQYQYFNLITCTDGPFSATHLFYLFNSFDYFLLMAWIYPFLLFWNFRTLVGAACAGRHDYEGENEQTALALLTATSPLLVISSSVQAAPGPRVSTKWPQGPFPFGW